MPQIKLSRSFFVKERRQIYPNWSIAFWRELIQNSVDAGATTLVIRTDEFPTVEFHDNGSGMSRSVLDNVYMALGETTKDENDVGGFGRARILTCFSHPYWELRSFDWVATPTEDGIGYTVEKLKKPRSDAGLSIKVVVDNAPSNGSTYEVYALPRTWNDVLEECDLPDVSVFVNGEAQAIKWGKAGNFLIDVLDAKLYEQDFKKGYLVVRVAGLVMFSQYVGYEGPHKGYLLELARPTSRKWLSAARSALQGDMKAKVDDLIKAVHRGEYDRFMKPIKPINTVYGEGVARTSEPTTIVSRRRYKLAEERATGSDLVKVFSSRKRRKTTMLPSDPKQRAEFLTEQAKIGRVWTPLQVYMDGRDIGFNVNGNIESLREKALEWDPVSWKGSVVNGFVFWSKTDQRKAKLLKAFTNAVDIYADIAATVKRAVPYITGIYVKPKLLGATTTAVVNGESIGFVGINPLGVTSDGAAAELYTDFSTDTFLDIASTAAHEVAHLYEAYHGEGWANLYSEIISHLPTDELLLRMKDGL